MKSFLKSLKDSNFKYSILSLIVLFLVVFLGFQKDTISDISFNQDTINRLYGYKEPEGGVTYLEALGLQYLSLGSIFSYGVNENVITYYYEGLMNQDLVKEEDNNNLLDTTLNISENTTSEKYLALEDVATIERGDYVDSNGEKIDGNKTLTITVPKTLTKENVKTASNAWKFTYHMYKDGLIGVDNAIWYSEVFSDTEVFDRAWNSLKWLCQDKIQCDILNDYGDRFLVLVYSNDWNWLVDLSRLNGDAFDSGDNLNYIKMTVLPLNYEDSVEILGQYGLVEKVE